MKLVSPHNITPLNSTPSNSESKKEESNSQSNTVNTLNSVEDCTQDIKRFIQEQDDNKKCNSTNNFPLSIKNRNIELAHNQSELKGAFQENLEITNLLRSPNKTPDVIDQEINAVNNFISSLNTSIAIQKRLSNLNNDQLRIFLPCLYVESCHTSLPINAFNIPDEGECLTKLDDNVAMIKSYDCFLKALNSLASENICDEAKIELLQNYIKKIIEILVFGDIKDDYDINQLDTLNQRFLCKKNCIYKGYEFGANRDLASTYKLKFLEENIRIMTLDDSFQFFGVDFNDSDKNKNMFLRLFSTKLYNAYQKKDISEIFNLTSDFMYAHILPNANGRISQVIRDCFALALGQTPFSSLTDMSHYSYLHKPVDNEHLKFMQENTLELLSAIESNTITFDLLKKNSNKQLHNLEKKSNNNEAILVDINRFKDAIGKRGQVFNLDA